MKLKQRKNKSIDKIVKRLKDSSNPYINKKELAKLKAAYKSGTLKFDSKEIAEAIISQCRTL